MAVSAPVLMLATEAVEVVLEFGTSNYPLVGVLTRFRRALLDTFWFTRSLIVEQRPGYSRVDQRSDDSEAGWNKSPRNLYRYSIPRCRCWHAG